MRIRRGVVAGVLLALSATGISLAVWSGSAGSAPAPAVSTDQQLPADQRESDGMGYNGGSPGGMGYNGGSSNGMGYNGAGGR